MSNPKYEISLLTPSGDMIADLSGFNMLTWARAEKKVGVAELWIPEQAILSPSFLAVDQIIEIERNGGILNETAYFLRYAAVYDDADGNGFYYLKAYDANYLLKSRIIASYSQSAEAAKSGYADDMMKELVDENIVSATDTDRNIANLTIASDLSLGAVIDKAMAWDNLLSALQDIAKTSTDRGTYLSFDVVRASRGNFQFRTYTGQRGKDHTQSSGDMIEVSEGVNFQQPNVILFDRVDEANVAYAGGRGVADDREITEQEDTTRSKASSYNRREVFVDARNTTTTAELEDKAFAALEENKPKKSMTGYLVDTDGCQYGIDYGFGDLVTATAKGYTMDCHLSAMSAIVSANQEMGSRAETLTTALRGDL